MTEEEVQAKIAAAKAEAEAAAKAQLDGLVSELKEERQKKQAIEAERDVLKNQLTPKTDNQPEDVESRVRKVLEERDQQEIVKNRQTAEIRFKNANKELFDESNDPGGLKWKAFEEKLSKLNLSGHKTEADFVAAFEDAMVLMNRPQPQDQAPFNPYAATPSDTSPSVTGDKGSKLSTKEQAVIKMAGISEEKYLQLKKTKPGYVASLLAMVPGN